MKTVKFKNGTYGVRKLTLTGYKFAVNHTGAWYSKNPEMIQEFPSLEEAERVLSNIRERNAREADMGTSIKP